MNWWTPARVAIRTVFNRHTFIGSVHLFNDAYSEKRRRFKIGYNYQEELVEHYIAAFEAVKDAGFTTADRYENCIYINKM